MSISLANQAATDADVKSNEIGELSRLPLIDAISAYLACSPSRFVDFCAGVMTAASLK